MKLLSYLLFFFFIVFISHAKVDAYNYNFSLDQLKPYFPGNRISNLKDLEILSKKDGLVLARTKIIYERYKYTIHIQAYNEVILDFFSQLPSFFVHDLFHQALINRLGKQTQFIKKESAALYVWKTTDNLNHFYQASCTITCFPEFYAVVGGNFPGGIKPFLQRMNSNL